MTTHLIIILQNYPTELSYRIILQNYPTLLTIYDRDPQVDVGPSGQGNPQVDVDVEPSGGRGLR